MNKILMEDDAKPIVEHQWRLNPTLKEVVKKEVLKWLNADFIYAIFDSTWVSPIQVVLRQEVCIDYRKLYKATRKDHFPLPFIGQMLYRLAGHSHYCFLDGYSGYNQIIINPIDQEKMTFTHPYGTYSFRRMSFGLCNVPTTFQRSMMTIFANLFEDVMEVLMDVFWYSRLHFLIVSTI